MHLTTWSWSDQNTFRKQSEKELYRVPLKVLTDLTMTMSHY